MLLAIGKLLLGLGCWALGAVMYVADAHKPGRMKYVAKAETLLTALMELREMTKQDDSRAEYGRVVEIE